MTRRQATQDDSDVLWTVEDVARRLRCSTRTVQRHLAELGARRTIGGLRFRREDVLAYEDRQRVQPTAPVPTPIRQPEPPRPSIVPRSGINPVSGRPW